MPTNLAIDDSLLKEAQNLGGHKTKKETVNEALRQYIQWRKQLEILNLAGTIDFHPDFDAQHHRRRRKRG